MLKDIISHFPWVKLVHFPACLLWDSTLQSCCVILLLPLFPSLWIYHVFSWEFSNVEPSVCSLAAPKAHSCSCLFLHLHFSPVLTPHVPLKRKMATKPKTLPRLVCVHTHCCCSVIAAAQFFCLFSLQSYGDPPPVSHVCPFLLLSPPQCSHPRRTWSLGVLLLS